MFCGLVILTSCSTATGPEPVQVRASTVESRLDRIMAKAVDASLLVAHIEAARASEQAPLPVPDLPAGTTLPEELTQLVSVDWTGPMQPLIASISRHIGYDLVIVGSEPAHSVVITINRRDEPVWIILRDIGINITTSASLILNPETRTITLHYPAQR